MNREEFNDYSNKMYKNIENKLEKDSEEFAFFYLFAESFNKTCEEKENLQNALDEIKKYIQEHKVKHYKLIDEPNGIDIILLENEIDYLLEIIKKAKGE